MIILGLEIPNYVWWILGIVAAAVIYLILDDDMKASVKVFAKKYGIWVVLILAWFFFKDRWGAWYPENYFGKKANTIFTLIILSVLLAKNFLARERYVSTQAICDNRSGSCAEYEQQGEYVIMNIGSCDAPAFPWSSGHETWIVPVAHFNKINNKPNSSRTQIRAETKVQKCDLLEVPSIAFDFISSTPGYNKDEIYYGEFSMDEILRNKEISISDDEGKSKVSLKPDQLETKMKDTNRMLNEARTMLKGKLTAIKGYVSDAATIQRKASGKNAFTIQNPQDNFGGQ